MTDKYAALKLVSLWRVDKWVGRRMDRWIDGWMGGWIDG